MDYIRRYCNVNSSSNSNGNPDTDATNNFDQTNVGLSDEERRELKELCAIRKEDRNNNRVLKCGKPVKPSRFNTQTVQHQMSRRRRLAEFIRVKSIKRY